MIFRNIKILALGVLLLLVLIIGLVFFYYKTTTSSPISFNAQDNKTLIISYPQEDLPINLKQCSEGDEVTRECIRCATARATFKHSSCDEFITETFDTSCNYLCEENFKNQTIPEPPPLCVQGREMYRACTSCGALTIYRQNSDCTLYTDYPIYDDPNCYTVEYCNYGCTESCQTN